LLRPAYLSQNLNRPLPTKDGGTLRTISKACDYMTDTGKQRERRDGKHWQSAHHEPVAVIRLKGI
jgi:hypothetical protein